MNKHEQTKTRMAIMIITILCEAQVFSVIHGFFDILIQAFGRCLHKMNGAI